LVVEAGGGGDGIDYVGATGRGVAAAAASMRVVMASAATLHGGYCNPRQCGLWNLRC